MTKWHIRTADLTERDKDYDANFTCTNGETGQTVLVQFTQQKGGPVSDIVGALRSVAHLLVNVSNDDKLEPTKLN